MSYASDSQWNFKLALLCEWQIIEHTLWLVLLKNKAKEMQRSPLAPIRQRSGLLLRHDSPGSSEYPVKRRIGNTQGIFENIGSSAVTPQAASHDGTSPEDNLLDVVEAGHGSAMPLVQATSPVVTPETDRQQASNSDSMKNLSGPLRQPSDLPHASDASR
eukprot:scaffold344576_cov31-Prasinocladus_malaysianus.AAC.1